MAQREAVQAQGANLTQKSQMKKPLITTQNKIQQKLKLHLAMMLLFSGTTKEGLSHWIHFKRGKSTVNVFKKLTDGDETHLLTYMGDRRRDVHRPLRLSADSPVNKSSAAYFSEFLFFYSAEVLMYWFFPAAIFQSYKINSRCAKIFSPHHFVYLCSQYKTINNVQGYPALQCN